MSVHHEPGKPRPWRVKWRDDGRQRSRSFPTRREAVLFEAEVLRAQALAADPIRELGTMTLGMWAEEWMTTHGPTWAPSTRKGRAVYLDKHVLPFLEDVPLAGLTRRVVSRWRAALIQEGRSNDTVNHATRVLSACLGRAVEDELLAGNPCAGLRSLRHRVERPRAFTEGEMRALLDAAHTDRDRRLIALMGYAGLRPGEALALRWGDVDGGLIHVSRSLLSDGSVSTPKDRDARTVRVSKVLAAELCVPGDTQSLVAPAAHGGPLKYRGWYRHSWRPLRARAGVTGAPYDLRHTFASRRIAEGATVVEVAAEMGHADPSMTLRRYAHLFERARHSSPGRE